MARAQAQQLYESLQQLNDNISKENEKMANEKDKKKVTTFFKKVGTIANKIPVVRELWNKLGMKIKSADPIFSQIHKTLKSIIDKGGLVEKGIIDAFDAVSAEEEEKKKENWAKTIEMMWENQKISWFTFDSVII